MTKALVGWIVRRRRTVKKRTVCEYANGAGFWAPERRRAFVFTTTMGADHNDGRGNRGGRAWARGHLAVLLHTTACKGWRFGLVRIVRQVAA